MYGLYIVNDETVRSKKIDEYHEDIKYTYYGDRGNIKNHGGVITIASIILKECNMLNYGFSFCSPKDIYNKEIGKQIAYDNLVGNYKIISFRDKVTHHNIGSIILAHVLALNKYPSWARELVESKLVNHIVAKYDLQVIKKGE